MLLNLQHEGIDRNPDKLLEPEYIPCLLSPHLRKVVLVSYTTLSPIGDGFFKE